MKKISLIIALAFCVLAYQHVQAQDDTNKVEVKKKMKTSANGHKTIKTKIKGSGTAGTAGVIANGTTPTVNPVVVTAPAVTVNTPPPAPAVTPAEPKVSSTTTTTTTTTAKAPTPAPVSKRVTATTTTHVVHKTTAKKPLVVKKTTTTTVNP